jgi:hypothetical protein
MWIIPVCQIRDHPIPKFILIPGPKLRPNHARVVLIFKLPRPRMLLAPVLSVLLTLSMEDALRRRFLTWGETGNGGRGVSFVRRDGGGGIIGAGKARSPVDEVCAVPNAYGPEIAGRGLGSDKPQLLLLSDDGGLCLRLGTRLSAAALSRSRLRVGALRKASRSASTSSTFVSGPSSS